MGIGYARVSTEDQTLNLQRDALKKAKCRQIYEEHASRKNTARPELEACFKSLRQGDTLIVWRLDRLGHRLADLIRLTQELQDIATQLGVNRSTLYRNMTLVAKVHSPDLDKVRYLLAEAMADKDFVALYLNMFLVTPLAQLTRLSSATMMPRGPKRPKFLSLTRSLRWR
jgi:hypothetical protein